MYLIVGLGNPGDKFANTRHNLGYEVVDELRRKFELGEWKLEDKFKAEVLKNDELVLVRPVTFMNLSGMAVSNLARFFKVPPEQVIIIHDELDLPIGHMKIRLGGSDAGHHGVESVMNELGSDKFVRLRLGIGTWKATSGEHKHAAFNAEKYVVEDFGPGEKSKVKAMIKRSVKAIEAILSVGVDKAQNQYNDKGSG
jgi:peptidyl-tRNA hydrolase, PTH1 family